MYRLKSLKLLKNNTNEKPLPSFNFFICGI